MFIRQAITGINHPHHSGVLRKIPHQMVFLSIKQYCIHSFVFVFDNKRKILPLCVTRPDSPPVEGINDESAVLFAGLFTCLRAKCKTSVHGTARTAGGEGDKRKCAGYSGVPLYVV
jgi:hypothetical protein